MSKIRTPFATRGWENTQSSGEMVMTKEERERLAELMKKQRLTLWR